jgi:thioredoxin
MQQIPRRLTPATHLVGFVLALALFASACDGGFSETTAAGPSLVRPLGSRGEFDSAAAAAGERLMMIDLYADWCGPCRQLAPIMEALAREHGDTLVVYKVNVDQSEELARHFGVRGIPHVAFVRRGRTLFALQGLQPKANYEKVIRKLSGQG